jgi:hypothetical protein
LFAPSKASGEICLGGRASLDALIKSKSTYRDQDRIDRQQLMWLKQQKQKSIKATALPPSRYLPVAEATES